MADEQARPSGEARIDAILEHLKEKHGFHFPQHLAPEPKEEPGSGSERWESEDWTKTGDGKDYPSEEEVKAEEIKHEDEL